MLYKKDYDQVFPKFEIQNNQNVRKRLFNPLRTKDFI